MARERYHPSDNQWVSYPNADWAKFIKDVESQLGASLPMSIQPSGEVIIDFDKLPRRITENEAKQVVKDNHPHR